VTVELWDDDVVLARELWGCGTAWIVLSTVWPKEATMALVGDEAPVAIGRQQGVDEHERATGKLAQGLIGAEAAGWWLPTAMPSVAGAGEERRRWNVGQGSRIGKSSGGIECRG
jgi:hypothetical protein